MDTKQTPTNFIWDAVGSVVLSLIPLLFFIKYQEEFTGPIKDTFFPGIVVFLLLWLITPAPLSGMLRRISDRIVFLVNKHDFPASNADVPEAIAPLVAAAKGEDAPRFWKILVPVLPQVSAVFSLKKLSVLYISLVLAKNIIRFPAFVFFVVLSIGSAFGGSVEVPTFVWSAVGGLIIVVSSFSLLIASRSFLHLSKEAAKRELVL